MLSVVIPVFNEEARLRETLAAVGRHMSQIAARIAASSIKSIPATGAFEIVVSDDGSRDRSVAIAEEVARELPIRLLRGEKNQGKGAAVRRGMVAAAGDPVFFFDADLSTPLSEISPFLDALDAGADVVIGTRKHRQAQIVRPQPWHRVQLGLAYTRLTNLLLGLHVSDFTCGFKAFRAAAAREIFTRQKLDRWSFDAEILYLARRRRLKVVEIPVRWADRPDSRVRVGSAIVKSFLELLEIRRRAARGDYGEAAPEAVS